jgi:hypothetical protein
MAFGLGTGCTVLLTVTFALFGLRDPLWMAAALAAGQVASVALVSVWTARLIPSVRGPIFAGVGAGALLLAMAAAVIGVEKLRLFAASAACLLGLAALRLLLLNRTDSSVAT